MLFRIKVSYYSYMNSFKYQSKLRVIFEYKINVRCKYFILGPDSRRKLTTIFILSFL